MKAPALNWSEYTMTLIRTDFIHSIHWHYHEAEQQIEAFWLKRVDGVIEPFSLMLKYEGDVYEYLQYIMTGDVDVELHVTNRNSTESDHSFVIQHIIDSRN